MAKPVPIALIGPLTEELTTLIEGEWPSVLTYEDAQVFMKEAADTEGAPKVAVYAETDGHDCPTELADLKTRFPDCIPIVVTAANHAQDPRTKARGQIRSELYWAYVEPNAASHLLTAVRGALSLEINRTEVRRLKESLKAAERKALSSALSGDLATIIFDPETSTIKAVNDAYCRFYGVAEEELLHMKASEIFKEDGQMAVGQSGAPSCITKTGKSRHRRADGTVRDVEVICHELWIGEKLYRSCSVRDTTDQVVLAWERQALADRLTHYLETSPTITYSFWMDEGESRWMWVSDNIRRVLGYTAEEALIEEWWIDNIHKDDKEQALRALTGMAVRGQCGIEYRFRRKDRSFIWIRDEMRVAEEMGTGMEIVGTLTDISEYRAAEAELRLKGSALDSASNSIMIADRAGTVIWANNATCSLSGYDMDSILGKNLEDQFSLAENTEDIEASLKEMMWGDKGLSALIRNNRPNGDQFIEILTITPIVSGARGKDRHFIVVRHDVTAQERYRERLERLLRERAVLIQELHHRVKNNMQLITSMISFSADQSGVFKLEKLMEDVTRRVMAMALVHDLFYHSDDLSSIDFSIYLRRLLGWLSETGDSNRKDAVVGVEALEPCILDLDKAIPASMIAAELLSYILATVSEGGRIRLTMDAKEPELVIRLSPEGEWKRETPPKNPGIDEYLVRSLAEQIKGSITIQRTYPMEAVLRIPLEPGRLADLSDP